MTVKTRLNVNRSTLSGLGRLALATTLAVAAATAVGRVGAQAPPAAQCPDGSPRSATGWCVGDIFAGIGGPVIYDGNGLPFPTWDVTGKPVARLDELGQPIRQNPEANPVISPRLMKVDGVPVCQYPDGSRVPASPVGSEWSCPAGSLGLLYEPVCINPATGDDTPGGGWTSDDFTAFCPAPSEPQYLVALPQPQNPGAFRYADQRGNFPPSGALLQSVVNPDGGFTYACSINPDGGHLFTTDFFTNKIHEFRPTTTGVERLQTIDLDNVTLGPRCGADTFGLIGGCGGVGPIVFASQNDHTTDLFVGTTMGMVGAVENVSKVLRYQPTGPVGAIWQPAGEYVVPVSMSDGTILDFSTPPLGGVTGLDLAADRETMFYTSGDSAIRVFNTYGKRLIETDLGERLIMSGLKTIKRDGSDEPDAENARFGLIPITTRSNPPLLDTDPAFQIRLLPPGDPLKTDANGDPIPTGILVARGTDVNILDLTPHGGVHGFLTARNRRGFVHDLNDDDDDAFGSLKQFVALEITPDGRSFWTGGLADGAPPRMLKYHIPTATLETPDPISPPGAAAINSLCIVRGYAAGALQPDCSLSSNADNPLCKPLPRQCSPGSLDPDCTPSGRPAIASQPPNLSSYEGDGVNQTVVSATDPSGGSLEYEASNLPRGLQMDPASGLVFGQIDANGAGDYHVAVEVENANGSAQTSFHWTVAERNLPPVIAVEPGAVFSPPHSGEVSIDLTGSDPDACDTVAFVPAPGSNPMPNWLHMPQGFPPGNAESRCDDHQPSGPFRTSITGTPNSVLGGTPTPTGVSFTFTVLAKDNWEDEPRPDGVRGIAPSQLQSITIDVANRAPVVVVTGNHAEAIGPNGALVSLNAGGSTDPDGDALKFRWSRGGTPLGANSTEQLQLPIGAHTIHLDVTDSFEATTSVDVQVSVVDRPPVLANVPADITVFTSSLLPIPVTYPSPGPTAMDLVDGPVAVICTPPSGSSFPIGTTQVTCTATDSRGNTASAVFNVTVNNQPPICTSAQPSVSELWPANHKFVAVNILGVTDPASMPLTLAITKVLQDEPTSGLGDGDTPIDAAINGSSVQLRAERSGKGDGRVYLIDFTATNSIGGACSGTVRVSVHRDQGKKGAAIDSLVRYNSLVAGGPPLPESQPITAGKSKKK